MEWNNWYGMLSTESLVFPPNKVPRRVWGGFFFQTVIFSQVDPNQECRIISETRGTWVQVLNGLWELPDLWDMSLQRGPVWRRAHISWIQLIKTSQWIRTASLRSAGCFCPSFISLRNQRGRQRASLSLSDVLDVGETKPRRWWEADHVLWLNVTVWAETPTEQSLL